MHRSLWNDGSSTPQTGRTGAKDLRQHFRRMEDLFYRPEPRDQAFRYVCDLLAWPAEKCTEDGRNRLLTIARWDEDRVRDRVREMVVDRTGSPGAALVVTEEGFMKKGRRSAGVERQYCASARRVDNYQIGLFLLYAGERGTAAAIDRELLLPPSWEGDAARRAASGVPAEIGARGREDLVLAMVDRVRAARVPAGWVVSDIPWYGDSARLRAALEARRMPYVLAVSAASAASAIVPDGAGGAFVRYLLPRPGGGCYLAFARRGTRLDDIAGAAARATAQECYFAFARREAGMDRYAARHWRAWYRHMSLAMFAHAYLRVGSRPLRPDGRIRPSGLLAHPGHPGHPGHGGGRPAAEPVDLLSLTGSDPSGSDPARPGRGAHRADPVLRLQLVDR